jgi:hypothetical protein
LTDGALSFATCSPSCGTCHRVIGARRRRPARSFVLHRSVACGAVGSGPWRGCSRAAGRTSCCDAPNAICGLRRADGCERLRCERCGWGAMSCGTARTACFACVLASSSPSLVNGMETTAGGSARPQAIDAASVRCDGSTRARTALPSGACSSRRTAGNERCTGRHGQTSQQMSGNSRRVPSQAKNADCGKR